MAHRKIENLITKDFVNDIPLADESNLLSASATEMTGLEPTIAHNEEEAQNYEEVYPYLPPLGLVPDSDVTPDIAEGIHAEYRTYVSAQKHDNHTK